MIENKITHEGDLDLNGLIIPCYVLENGERVLSTSGMQKALGVIGNEPDQRSSGRLDEILSSKVVSPFISDVNTPSKYKPITCYKGRQKYTAYNAVLLPEICEIMLKARDFAKENNIELGSRQKTVIIQADIIIRALARVGIIALVDEATGYQYDREKKELQAIFKELISDEISDWEETFHLSFYKEIFRLWKIPFTDKNIKRKPQFIGHITNRFIYGNMPQGTFVLEKLKEKTPKTKGGYYKYKLHQSLTKEKGKELLKKVIYSVEALASISESKDKFKFYIDEKYGQKSLFPYGEIDKLAKEEDALIEETQGKDITPSSGNSILDDAMEKALKGKSK